MTDVLVVGAGPAGSTLALRLARAGLDVLLLDRAAFPREKPCGEYLSPGVVRELHDVGAGDRVEAAAGARLRGFVIHAYGHATMRGVFGRASGWGDAPSYGLGLARATLDAILLDAARAAGARVRERVRVTDVLREGARVVGVRARTERGHEEHHARLVVAADGVRGVVGRRLGMVHPRPRMRRIALVARLAGLDGLSDFGEMHVSGAGYCGVAPLGGGCANVAMVLRPTESHRIAGRPERYFQEALSSFPGLGRRAAGAWPARAVLSLGPLSFIADRLVDDGVLLAGDAGGYYDPFTGQGVHKALVSARLATPVVCAALAAGTGTPARARLLPYERALRAHARGGFVVEWLVQQFLNRPSLFRRAVRLLGERETMADTLVGVTGDVLPARRVLSPRFLARLAI